MIMKLPTTNGSGNGYYGHDTSTVVSYVQENGNGVLDDLESPSLTGDFSEYMWMENEEEFDKQVMQQLEEEALMEECIEAMLEDEHYERIAYVDAYAHPPVQQNGAAPDLCQSMRSLRVQESTERSTRTGTRTELQNLGVTSTLNPNAAEFVPNFASVPAVTTAPTSSSD